MHTAPAADTAAPVTVGYLGNFKHPWCTEVHVANSLEQLGHKVHRWQEDATDWPTIPKLADRLGVQLLVWQRTWPAELAVVLPELDRLSTAGVRTVSYHLDRWWGLDREVQVAEQPFFHTDLVVSPDDSPKWAEAGVNHLWLPPGVYGPECTPVAPEPRRYPWEVVFVGSHPYPHAEWEPTRTALIDAMTAEFGDRFKVLPGAGKPQLRNRHLQALYATVKVVVGDSCLAGDTHRYWSDRIPETLGRGGLLVHPYTPGLDRWYESTGPTPVPGDEGGPGDDLLSYAAGHPDQAVALVQWALDNPEQGRQVADHGRRTVLGRDLYTHRMASLLDHLHANLPLRPARAPVAARPPAARSTARPGRQPAGEARPPARSTARDRMAGMHVVRHRGARQPGRFAVAEGHSDVTALHEVWTNDDYRLRPDQVRGRRVVDVGGNVGAFAVLAAAMGAAHVDTYEPHPDNRRVLEANLQTNRVATKVTVHGEAVSPLAEVVLVGVGGGASVLGPADTPAEHVYTVAGAEPDEVLRGAGYVKLDCEGAEYGILAAVSDEVLVSVERIAMEFHGPGMPHLAMLDHDGQHLERWQAMVGRLAGLGRVEIVGRPMVGGLLWWSRY